MAFHLKLDEAPDHWHLALSGELDYGECSQLRLSIHRILKSTVRSAIVDMSRLDYLDSSGVGVLLAMAKEYAMLGGELVLVTSEAVDDVLALLRINQLFTIAATTDQAIALLGGEAHVDSRPIGRIQPAMPAV